MFDLIVKRIIFIIFAMFSILVAMIPPYLIYDLNKSNDSLKEINYKLTQQNNTLILNNDYIKSLYNNLKSENERLKSENEKLKSEIDFYENQSKIEMTKEDYELLAKVVYHESRGEPIETQALVAKSIINRVLSPEFPNSVREVVYQPNQISDVHLLSNYNEESLQAVDLAISNKYKVPDSVTRFKQYGYFKSDIPYKKSGNLYFSILP